MENPCCEALKCAVYRNDPHRKTHNRQEKETTTTKQCPRRPAKKGTLQNAYTRTKSNKGVSKEKQCYAMQSYAKTRGKGTMEKPMLFLRSKKPSSKTEATKTKCCLLLYPDAFPLSKYPFSVP